MRDKDVTVLNAANAKLPVIERKIAPAIREGIEMVMMTVFLKLRERNSDTFPDMDRKFHSMLAAAVLNRIFGIENDESSYKLFKQANRQHIDNYFNSFAHDFPELTILVTDALRMQFVCNEVEDAGDKDHDIATMERAAKAGILLQDRDAPLPKGFMNLVYRIGVAHGLVRNQQA